MWWRMWGMAVGAGVGHDSGVWGHGGGACGFRAYRRCGIEMGWPGGICIG